MSSLPRLALATGREQVYEQRGKHISVAINYSRVWTISTRPYNSTPIMKTYICESWSSLHHANGDYDRHSQISIRAVQKDAKYAWAYENRAIAYAYKGDLQSAFADIDQAIKLSGDDENTYFARGKVYALQGEKDKAIADFNKAAQLTKRLQSQQDINRELQALQDK